MPDTTAPAPRGPLLAVIVLCLGGLSASLTQTMMIPIQSELPTLLSTSAARQSPLRDESTAAQRRRC